MSRRAAGISLIALSALLYASRYLAAAIFGSSITTWNAGLFNGMLQYVGPGLVRWSIVSLVVGILYLVWAEIQTYQEAKRSDSRTENLSEH